MLWYRKILILFAIVDATIALVPNATTAEVGKDLLAKDTRRKRLKKDRSTSSSSNELRDAPKNDENEDSLELSDQSSVLSSSNEKKRTTKSSSERDGWRKWHRKCTPCPEDMAKKHNDKSILWICGAYQRARRTFKSICMMHLRNCQDGTMFVKIRDGFCKSPVEGVPLGEHFFYDYDVLGSDDSSETEDESQD